MFIINKVVFKLLKKADVKKRIDLKIGPKTKNLS